MSLRIAFCLALGSMIPASVADARMVRVQPPAQISGVWDSTYGEVRLTQQGNKIRGTYPCCGGGTIEGYVTGNVVRFHWNEPRGAGAGEGIWRIRDGSLVGSWGHGQSVSDGATWNLWRPRQTRQIAQ